MWPSARSPDQVKTLSLPGTRFLARETLLKDNRPSCRLLEYLFIVKSTFEQLVLIVVPRKDFSLVHTTESTL